MVKAGKIDISSLDTPPNEHEFLTAKFLSNLGNDIVFIALNRRRGAKTPDIIMNGVDWEIKCPRGCSSRTIENNFRAAVQQSGNIIFDLRHTPLPDENCIRELQREFAPRKFAKKMIIITKKQKIIDIKK